MHSTQKAMIGQATALTLPITWRNTALAYPDKVKAALAKIETSEEAIKMFHSSDAYVKLAKNFGADTKAVNAIQRARLHVQAKLGELMPNGGKGGRGKKKPSYQVGEFNKNTLTRFHKVEKYADKIDDYYVNSINRDEPTEMSTAGFINFVGAGSIQGKFTGEIEWYTPLEWVEPAAIAMGGIDLDPASNKLAQAVVGAETYYSAEDDGLSKDWAGRVWLNPPYKIPLIRDFVFKLCDHVADGRVKQAVLLTNNSTDTEWFHRAWLASSAYCLTKGRISFYNAAGTHSSPTNGQTLMYFGRRRQAFIKAYSHLGICEARA